jgi:hypothetical protein
VVVEDVEECVEVELGVEVLVLEARERLLRVVERRLVRVLRDIVARPGQSKRRVSGSNDDGRGWAGMNFSAS